MTAIDAMTAVQNDVVLCEASNLLNLQSRINVLSTDVAALAVLVFSVNDPIMNVAMSALQTSMASFKAANTHQMMDRLNIIDANSAALAAMVSGHLGSMTDAGQPGVADDDTPVVKT